MLQTNLATRPLYNERLIHAVLVLVALGLAAFTAYNVTRIVSLSQQSGEFARQADDTERQAREVEQAAATIQRDVGGSELAGLEGAAREANVLIDRRIFSWTEFFNLIETSLPAGAMVTAVRPEIASDEIRITLSAVGRRVEDLDLFMEQLEATGAFTELLSRREEVTEAGTYRAVLEGRYTPMTEAAEPAPVGQGS